MTRDEFDELKVGDTVKLNGKNRNPGAGIICEVIYIENYGETNDRVVVKPLDGYIWPDYQYYGMHERHNKIGVRVIMWYKLDLIKY